MTLYKISPSDLTFAWDECKYCFYMRLKHNMQVKGPFPGIFTRMANLTSDFYLGRQTHEISDGLPAGIVSLREGYVKSVPISFPGIETQCYIRGRFDAVIEFENGSYGLVDYKTSEAREEHVLFYARQLMAYVYALENPAAGALGLKPISRMGLFVIMPDRFERDQKGEMIFANKTTWMEVPRDDGAFLALIEEVLRVLDDPNPPAPAENCGLCNYREGMKRIEDL